MDVDALNCASFPLRRGPRGYFARSQGIDVVHEAIEQVLCTMPGERVMRPRYGCDIHRHLFAPATERDIGVARSDIAEALRLWVPWITLVGGVQGVQVSIDGHQVSFTVRYRIGNGPPQSTDGEIILSGGG